MLNSINENLTQVAQQDTGQQSTPQAPKTQEMNIQSTVPTQELSEQFLASITSHGDSIPNKAKNSKKCTRNRHTRDERQLISQQYIKLYLRGWSVKRIAHELGARESAIKECLFGFITKHPDKITKTSVFLASDKTRMKDIDKENSVADFYEVEIKEDGTRICRPLTNKLTST